jgi:uncharacterized membrane protein
MRQHPKLGRLLTVGMALSAACLVAGLILSLVDRAQTSQAAPPHLLLDVGLIVLMVTPLVRIVASLAEELRARNWFFAAVTLVVVTVLCATLWTAVRSA